MLQKIRDKATGIIGAIIVVLISITFALWGIQNYFMGTSETTAAKINDTEITTQEFESRFAQYRQRLASQGIDVSFLDNTVRRREFLEGMIENELWRQAAESRGLEATPEAVRSEIEAIEAFRVNGEFNPDVYVELLRLQGMTPQQLERDIRTQILVQQIPETLIATGFVVEEEAIRLAQLQNQTRTFDYVVVSAGDFTEQVDVSDEEIASYYEQNRGRFEEPEKVTIEYLEVEASDYAGEIVVDDAILMDRYEQEKGRFRTPERRLASHILIEVPEDAGEETIAEARQQAEQLAEQARAGADFATLAAEHSDDVVSGEEGGDLGWISRGEMVTPFEEALFAMEEGAISDPVRTSFGFHVISLREVDPSRGKTFEEAKEELAAEYREMEAERQFLDIQNRLEEILNYSDAPDMQATAEEFGLELQTAGPFGRSGGAGIAANREVVNAAFSETVLDDGLVSDPLIIGPNHVVFVRVTDFQPASTKPLDEVRSQVAQAVRQQKAREAAKEKAEALLAEAEDAASLEALAAADENLVLKSAEAAARTSPEHNGRLLQEVFELPDPARSETDIHLVSFGGDNFAVVEMQAVEMPGAESITAPQKTAVSARASRSYAAAEVSAVGDRLRADADVVVNQDQVDLAQ